VFCICIINDCPKPISFTPFEYSSTNNIFAFVAMSADSVPSSKKNIFRNKLIYCRHFRTYSRWAMFDWSDTVFRFRLKYRCFVYALSMIVPSLYRLPYIAPLDLYRIPSIGKPRVSPLLSLNTSAVIRYFLELIRGEQCLIEVIRSSGEEMWHVDAYQIPHYSRGIEEAKRTHPRFDIGLWWRYGISRHCDEWKYIIIGRIFESEIILIPPSLKISESSSNGSYRNTEKNPKLLFVHVHVYV
jgi:hypothetical protein